MLKKLIYLCLAVVMISACGDDPIDPCAGVDCGANGVCIDGTCDCEDGYYGDSCDSLSQDLFLGTWNGVDCEGDDYTISITAGASPQDLVVINNGLQIAAVIENQSKFNIPTQTIVEPFFQIEIVIVGDGTLLEDGTLSFAASVSSPLGGGDCTSIMTKQ